jgi:predicted MFS family arabinose efflux permease
MSTVASTRRAGIARDAHVAVVGLVRKLLMIECAMYSIITPMLPHFARVLPASKPQLGVLAGAYAAGLLPGALLGGVLSVRVGVRRATFAGVLLFAFTTPVFGFLNHILLLDAVRMLQGVASGILWGGGLTWVVAVAPEGRRGEMIGTTISAAIVGMLIGPILGVAAVAISPALVFSALGVITLIASALVWREPEPDHVRETGTASPWTLARSAGAMLGTWLTVLEAMAFGGLFVLIPLRLAQLGASTVEIGATFLLSSVLAMLVAPRLGVICDRHGTFPPVVVALASSALLLITLPVPSSALVLAALTFLLMGGPLSGFMVPSVSMISDSAESRGVALAVSTMLFNIAYAVGETIGAPASAFVSHHTSDAVPLVGLAVTMALTLVPVVLWRRRLDGSVARASG